MKKDLYSTIIFLLLVSINGFAEAMSEKQIVETILETNPSIQSARMILDSKKEGYLSKVWPDQPSASVEWSVNCTPSFGQIIPEF